MAGPTVRRARLDPQLRRRLIIDAAIRTCAGRDPAAVTFEEIAAEADVSRALLYTYFGDRNGLLAEVFLRCFDEVSAAVDRAIDPGAPPEDRVRSLVDAYVGYAAENPVAWRLLQQSTAMAHPAVQAARDVRMVQVSRWLGGPPSGPVLAYGVVGLLENATMAWLADDDEHEVDHDPGAVTDLIHELLWHGLAGVGALRD